MVIESVRSNKLKQGRVQGESNCVVFSQTLVLASISLRKPSKFRLKIDEENQFFLHQLEHNSVMSNKNEATFAKILKFGGSSVSTPERIQNVMSIIKKAHSSHRIAVVVSAFGGVTDKLISIARQAVNVHGHHEKDFDEIKKRHINAVTELVSSDRLEEVLATLEEQFLELESLLKGIHLIHELSLKTLDSIMSFGERFSAFIISAALNSVGTEASFVDARWLIQTNRNFGSAQVDFEQTNLKISNYFATTRPLAIISGFIASSGEGETTTLGRGGSDYSAAIFGAALDVQAIEIWTDVDGVMTADPRKEEFAFPIPEMSYKEAMEMSHFGAKVIHPPTISPALQKNIPLYIKNSFNPQAAGTLVSTKPSLKSSLICGVSSIDHVALLCLQGSGMVGICGIAKRLFSALSEKEINVILITQGSSEHSICFAVLPELAELAKDAIHKEFAFEMRAHTIEEIAIERQMSIIAVVGENMPKSPRISGKLFEALGRNGINIVAIAQGSSELNISVVVKREDQVKAINVIHESFFLSPQKTLNLFLVGTGLIGSTLLKKIENEAETTLAENGIAVRVVGLANSRKMHLHREGIDLSSWQEKIEQSPEKTQMKEFIHRMKQFNLMNCVFVDCTSNQEITLEYENILAANISIITPNKKASSSDYAIYSNLKKISKEKGVKFSYGSTVGAGLPIISTINELRHGGDKILKIEAILSGTLSYIFNSFSKGGTFSQIVKEAQQKGYTEPDPRDDLNGMDVARKLLILARESGYQLELSDLSLESVLPSGYFVKSSVEDFFIKLKEHDTIFENMRKEAQAQNKVLRYIASFVDGKGRISLQAISSDHPFYHIAGSDNIAALSTRFYFENPLVIKGQGAGATVTAAKVFGDMLRIGLELKR